MSISSFKVIGKSPLTTVVYENIKQAIITNEIAPGTRLTEVSISKQLGVSSTPVREAFRRLESERLVKIIPYRGVVVQQFSTKEIDEVYQCRRSLEVLAIKLAVDTIDDKGLMKLQNLVEKSKKEKDFSEYVSINTAIHDIIMSYAGNGTLESLLQQLQDVIYHNRNVSSFSPTRKKEIYEEHLQIIKALEERDKDAAAQAMSDHILNGYEYIKTKTE